MLMYRAGILFLAFIIDGILGDPKWLYHPICLTGNLISFLQNRLVLLFPNTDGGKRKAGIVLVCIVCFYSLLLPTFILLGAYRIHLLLGLLLETFWCYQLLAARSLKKESMKVCDKLIEEDLPGARHAVSMIVGRDTAELTKEGVIKAAVETVAENTTDGVVAPLIYMAIGGLPLMFLYKGINTMDSMIGYKDEKYLHLGRCAALLDDGVNYIPARLAGIFTVGAAYILGFNGAKSWSIFRRDRYNHASPNSAQTESAVAGALEVQLAGDAKYFGKWYKKPAIGDPIRNIEPRDIPKANSLMYGASILALMGNILILVAMGMILR